MKRITAIDTLKGLMLVIIIVDHLGGPLKTYTWETLGFITATEGFVLLSGILTGIVYRWRVDRSRAVWAGIGRRTLTLYQYQLLPFLGIVLIYLRFPANVGYAYYWKRWLSFFNEAPLQALWNSITLQYQPQYFDVLSMYILFSLFIPVLIFAFKKGWGEWILAASFALWLTAQFDVPWLHGLTHGAFDRSAWQVLFVFGSYIGYRHRTIHRQISRTPPAMLALPAALALVFFAIRHNVLPTPNFITPESIHRHYLGWVRLLNFSIVAYLIAWLNIFAPYLFSIKWLAFIGKHSLQVYVYQNVFVYFIQPIYPRLKILGDGWWIFFVLLSVAGLTVPAILAEFRPCIASARAARRCWQKQLIPILTKFP